jgi:hypothetical protein
VFDLRSGLSLGMSALGHVLECAGVVRCKLGAEMRSPLVARGRPSCNFGLSGLTKRVRSDGTVLLRQYRDSSQDKKRAKESQAVVQRFSPTLNCLKVWPCLLQVPIIRDCFVAPVHLLELIAEEVLFLFENAWFGTETFWVSFEVVPVCE